MLGEIVVFADLPRRSLAENDETHRLLGGNSRTDSGDDGFDVVILLRGQRSLMHIEDDF